MEIICVPLIVSLTYAIIEFYKKVIAKQNETLNRIIPLIGLALGALAGVVCFYAMPEIIVANNLLSAIIVGASSGLSATGCNQIFKQLKKYGIKVETSESETTAQNSTENSETSDEQKP